jgi:hypothetical protein
MVVMPMVVVMAGVRELVLKGAAVLDSSEKLVKPNALKTAIIHQQTCKYATGSGKNLGYLRDTFWLL